MPVSLALIHPVGCVHEPAALLGAVGGSGSSETLTCSGFGAAGAAPVPELQPVATARTATPTATNFRRIS